MPHYRNADQWHALFEQQKNSGLGIAAFCQQKNLTTSNFYTWRKKLGVPTQPSLTPRASKWHAIEPVSVAQPALPDDTPSWDLELSLPGGTVLRLRH